MMLPPRSGTSGLGAGGQGGTLVAVDLAAETRPAVRVIVKVRYAPFITETHGVPLGSPSSDAAVIEQAARDALGRFTGRRPVRLLGVRAEFGS